jgi:hypothetical protein
MAGGLLHVALDVDYADDEAIILAGEKAELLYVRALCTAKKSLSDGFVADAQIARYGLTGWQQRARRLVDVGLWRRDPTRAGYWILGWTDIPCSGLTDHRTAEPAASAQPRPTSRSTTSSHSSTVATATTTTSGRSAATATAIRAPTASRSGSIFGSTPDGVGTH